MDKKTVIIVTQIILMYLIINLLNYVEYANQVINIVLNLCLILTAFYFLGYEEIVHRFNMDKFLIAFLISGLQISLLVFSGFMYGFGKSPYSLAPLMIIFNFVYFFSQIIGFELTRYVLIKSFPKRSLMTGIITVSFLFTVLSLPVSKFLTIGNSAESIRFIGSDILPTISQSILSTLLVLLGGPLASVTYHSVLTLYEILVPVLANPPWMISALIGAGLPAFGLLLLEKSTPQSALLRLGLRSKSERRAMKKDKLSSYLLFFPIVLLLISFGGLGYFGFQFHVIASGSMTPALDVGDIALTAQISPSQIKVGDVIQYQRSDIGSPIIHRVVGKYDSNGYYSFVTKGDANTEPDDPILPTGELYRVVWIIPKIGTVTLAIRYYALIAIDTIAKENLTPFILSGLILITSIFLFIKLINSRNKRVKTVSWRSY